MSVTGHTRSAPLRIGFPVCDTIGGLTAAFAIASALVGRNGTGRGTYIDTSMLDATLVTLGWVVSNYLIAGVVPSAMGNDNMTAAPSGAFETADGLLNIAANKQDQFESLCRILRRDDLIEDPRFAERDRRKQNRAALTVEIEHVLRTRPARHWEEALNRAGIPAGRVLTVPEALDSPQVRHRRLVQTLDTCSPADRPIQVVRAGFQFQDGEPGADTPPPRLGQHTEEVLQAMDYDESTITRLRRDGVI
jgi:CoA:oxalate CoA-transferase